MKVKFFEKYKKILGVLAHFTTFKKQIWSGVGYHYVITRMKVLSHRQANAIFIAMV